MNDTFNKTLKNKALKNQQNENLLVCNSKFFILSTFDKTLFLKTITSTMNRYKRVYK